MDRKRGACFYCGKEFNIEELRPYGPKYQLVCFECGTLPENEAISIRSIKLQIDACGDVCLVGLPQGPIGLNENS